MELGNFCLCSSESRIERHAQALAELPPARRNDECDENASGRLSAFLQDSPPRWFCERESAQTNSRSVGEISEQRSVLRCTADANSGDITITTPSRTSGSSLAARRSPSPNHASPDSGSTSRRRKSKARATALQAAATVGHLLRRPLSDLSEIPKRIGTFRHAHREEGEGELEPGRSPHTLFDVLKGIFPELPTRLCDLHTRLLVSSLQSESGAVDLDNDDPDVSRPLQHRRRSLHLWISPCMIGSSSPSAGARASGFSMRQ